MAEAERRLSIYSRGAGVFKVEMNGVTVPHVTAVSFSADANKAGIDASMRFHVDVADLIDTVSSMLGETA